MVKRFLFISLVLSSSFIFPVFSQSFYDWKIDRRISASIGAGASTYFGELNFDDELNFDFSTIGIGLEYRIYKRYSARGQLIWYKIAGTDEGTNNASRNLSFRANNFDLSVIGILNILHRDIGTYYYHRKTVEPYLFVGLGVTFFNPKTEFEGNNVALRPLETEGSKYFILAPIVPFGFGVKFKLNYLMDISFEGGFRYAFTDYLDDVSTVHINNDSFTDPIAKALADRRPEIGKPVKPAGTQRGNPDVKDFYSIAHFRFDIYLPEDFFRKRSNKPKIKLFRKYNKKLYSL